MEGLENEFAKHYNRALKIMRPYLNGDKKEKSKSVKSKIIKIPETSINVLLLERLFNWFFNLVISFVPPSP